MSECGPQIVNTLLDYDRPLADPESEAVVQGALKRVDEGGRIIDASYKVLLETVPVTAEELYLADLATSNA